MRRAITVLAATTVREALRDRVLYLVAGFGLVILIGTKLFGWVTVGDQAKVMLDLGLAAVQWSSMLIAVMMGTLLISREVSSRSVYAVVSRPIPRRAFLLGKYLGLVTVVVANVAVTALLLVVLVVLYAGRFEPWVLLAAGLIAVEMVVVSAFAILFAVSTRPMLGAVFTLAVFATGHLSEDLWLLTRHLPGDASRWVISVLYHVFPNLERFNLTTEVVHELTIPWPAVGWAVVYGVAYAAFVLVLACWRFERRDLE